MILFFCMLIMSPSLAFLGMLSLFILNISSVARFSHIAKLGSNLSIDACMI